MKRFLLFSVLVVCGFAACSKNDAPDEGLAEETFSVNAGLPSQATKTTLGDKSGSVWPLLWSEGDRLLLNGVPSVPLAAGDAGAASATFRFSGVGGATVWNFTYCGVADSDCTVVFPTAQSSSDGRFASYSLPMYATASTAAAASNISLIPLGAVLRFSFTSSSAITVSQIELQALGGESICGDFAIGKSGNGRLNGSLSAAGNNRDKLVVAAGVALSSTPRSFCIVVPAGTYSDGFQARITSSTGKIMEVWFNTKSNKTLSAGTLYNFGEAAFVPMGSSIMSVMSRESFTIDAVSF